MSTTAPASTPSIWRRALKQKRLVVGGAITGVIVLFAVLGPAARAPR